MIRSGEFPVFLRLRLGPWLRSYGIFVGLAIGLIACIGVGSRYEREFRSSLEQGFQHRVELGDLASSVQQLRRVLEAPIVLDPGYFAGLVERSKEVELKAKAQSEAGRFQDLALPLKELGALAGMQKGFERLATSHALVERAHSLKSTLRLNEPADAPAIRKVSGALEEYAGAVSAIRGTRSSVSGLQSVQAASVAIAENLPTAMNESRRKNAPQGWRDVLAILPSERGDLQDRLLADGRLVEDFLAQRVKAISRLEQVSARIDSAERLLLQARSSGGLLVASALLTWGGVGLGVLGLLLGALGIDRARKESQNARAEEYSGAQSGAKDFAEEGPDRQSSSAEALIAEKIANEAKRGTSSSQETMDEAHGTVEVREELDGINASYPPSRRGEAYLAQPLPRRPHASVRELAEAPTDKASDDTLEAVTSGYWIAAGSMAERRVALLDRQSEQFERHVGSVMAAVDTLANRIEATLESLHAASELERAPSGRHAEGLRKRVEDLQTLAMNLSLKFTSSKGAESVLDDLEHLGKQLESLTDDIRGEMEVDSLTSPGRRIEPWLEEARRMAAASSALGERAETLLEDAQRFRRHAEALIRGIQDGAVTELPSVYLKGQSRARRALDH